MHVTGWGRAVGDTVTAPPRPLSRRVRWILTVLGLLVLAAEVPTVWAWLFEGTVLETTARQDLVVTLLSGLSLVLALSGPVSLCTAYVLVVGVALLSSIFAMPALTLPFALAFGGVYLRSAQLRVFVALLAVLLVASFVLHPENLNLAPYLAIPALVGAVGGLMIRGESGKLAAMRLRASQLAESRDRAVANVRRSLARDLHDVVAQQLAIIAMQTQAMKLAPDAATQRAMAETVAEVAREAHADLRGLLSVLYTASDDPARESDALTPALVTSASDAVDSAARRLREDGFEVAVHVPDAPGVHVPRHVSATVHRIVQEACANVLRHAPRGSRCELSLSATPGRVRIAVVNDMRPAEEAERLDRLVARADARRSFGVVNIVERAELLGGTATAGPRDGRWHVEAEIPFTPVR